MTTSRIFTAASRHPYAVHVGRGLFDRIGTMLAANGAPPQVCIVTDDTVGALYGAALCAALTSGGAAVCTFTFPHGETGKCADTYVRLLSFLAKQGITRADAVVTLGGGVACDLGGFAAATYMRGIGLYHIPTSLLACVDAAVGGKAGIDLPEGKNLAGAFYAPRAVFCDPDLLASLPEAHMADGCAEVIKYAMIGDDVLFSLTARAGLCYADAPEIWEEIVCRCIQKKIELTSQDEHDLGVRRLLNFGHTVGHAVEAASGYTVPHGRAVAAGMACVTRASVKRGWCPERRLLQLEDALTRFGLPVRSPCRGAALEEAMLRDKKRGGGNLCWIVPDGEGCRVMTLEDAESVAFLRECTEDEEC